ncbi:tail fiber domain-containing protein [Stenotrophomonas geniculata]|uniref:tail fiber domain-containing protein n=1 Tax=Stenotrophomonas geniculata TaxID=86188 RepID=UPI002E79C32D|nr:tail fiber domain-containing protein [Stenotrophomonas geniculata]
MTRTAAGADGNFALGNLAGIAGAAVATDQSVYLGSGGWASYSLTAAGRALSGVAGTANTFPYFSAANVVTLGSVTATGLSVLSAADATAARAVIQAVGLTGADSVSGVKTFADRAVFSTGIQLPADQTAQWSTGARIHATFRGALISSVDNGIFAAGSTTTPGRFSFRTQGNSSNVNQVSIEADGTFNFTTGIRPFGDNAADVGTAALRVRTYFGVNAAINTSDARLKTEPRQLSDAERKAGSELARLPAIWEWLTGDRLHAGPTVQAAMTVMEANGLDPFAYSFICYDEWEAEPAAYDDEGNELTPARDAGDRYSFRKEELLCFMVSALAAENDLQAAKIEAMDARLAAVEARA